MSRLSGLHAMLLGIWAAGSFGVPWLARELDWVVHGWPFHLWWAAQGCILFFVALCAAAVRLLGRSDDDPDAGA